MAIEPMLKCPIHVLPFKITEGEYEIVVEHDVVNNVLSRMQINAWI